jgi:hypothetical protein
MYTAVTRDQFEVRDDTFIHTPTGAEFTPNAETMLVWTGDLGRRLPSGEVFAYAEVLAMMRTVWCEVRMRVETPEWA